VEPRTTSEATTSGVKVLVESAYLREHSVPSIQRYVFAYTVRIENVGDTVVQLVSRHWIVTHGDGHVEEVRGPGVVGEKPTLSPGEGFRYTSGCVLRTPRGTMHGTYRMIPREGDPFDATIAPFLLEMPYSLN
jgi:ApaG protein